MPIVTEGAITVVLDNARYQKCAMVQDCAAALGIELLYLPSFSPHLNLIERLWRFVQQGVLVLALLRDLSRGFEPRWKHGCTTAHWERRIELETLLAWNFGQSFRDVKNGYPREYNSLAYQ